MELVKRSKEIAESTHTTEKHLKQQKGNTVNLVEFSNRLLSTVKVFKLPKIEMQKKTNVDNVEIPELKNVLEAEDNKTGTSEAKQANT